jgi:hypothetical protein
MYFSAVEPTTPTQIDAEKEKKAKSSIFRFSS